MPDSHPQKQQTPADIAARMETVARDIVLPKDALVMRGGILQRSDLIRSLALARKKLKRPGLSVFAADVPTPADLLNLMPLPNGQVSFTTVSRLAEVGFDLEQTGDRPHYTAWLPEDDQEDDGFWIQMFQSSFDKPVSRDKVASYRVSTH